MKRMAILMAGALAVAACTKDTAAPVSDSETSTLLDDAASLAFSASFVANPGDNFLPGINRLPENLKLSAAQEAAIKALVDAFALATKADHEALAAIRKQAEDAKKAGKTPAEIEAILRQGEPIRQRLATAEAALRKALSDVLTPAQKAWLDSNKPASCSTLTDAQRTQIASLIAAYEQANKADLDAVKAALDKARAAREAHATNEQIKAILSAVQPNMDRLKASADKLRADMEAVLTPEQRAAHCVKLPEPPRPKL